jgi:hypothetical protein
VSAFRYERRSPDVDICGRKYREGWECEIMENISRFGTEDGGRMEGY